jgi:hypothetical protein
MSATIDVEKADDGSLFLVNNTVQDFSWKDLTVTVKDRATKEPRQLISEISGSVQQGMIQPFFHPGFMLTLRSLRRTTGSYGSFGLWQNNASQRTGSPHCSIRGQGQRRMFGQ